MRREPDLSSMYRITIAIPRALRLSDSAMAELKNQCRFRLYQRFNIPTKLIFFVGTSTRYFEYSAYSSPSRTDFPAKMWLAKALHGLYEQALADSGHEPE